MIKSKQLSGRTALVTGGSRGIGRAIALALAQAGAEVAICGREARDLAVVKKAIQKLGRRAHAFEVDSGNAEAVKQVAKELGKRFKRLDILVNNIGGVRQFAKFPELSDDNWQEVFETNLMSMVRFTRALLPLLQKSKRGRIINIASIAGRRPGNFNPHYGAMKVAVIFLSKHLSNFLGPKKILVNCICPSTIRGGVWMRDVQNKARMFNLSYVQAEREMEKEVKAKSPLGEIGQPEDVAAAVVFLASDQAKFITGVCLDVDGGWVNSIF